jgi:hypothetical protein
LTPREFALLRQRAQPHRHTHWTLELGPRRVNLTMAREGPPKPRDSLLPVFTVLVAALALVVSVVAMAGLAGLFVILAIASVLGFAAMHYLLWGWWLSRRLHDTEDEAGEQKTE